MILVWNCGSSSIKYYIFDESLTLKAKGLYDNLDIDKISDFREKAILAISEIKNVYSDITNIAFRIVSAGKDVKDGSEIDETLIIKIENESKRILHNKAVLEVIKCSITNFPNVSHSAYFDTSFFNDLPQVSKSYALPSEMINRFKIDRLGFHGISHRYALSLVGKYNKVISIHLGAGCSVAAIYNGKPIDISMGHSTNEGLIMQTRSGDVDSMLVLELADGIGISSTRDLLQMNSGLKGLTKSNGEMLEILDMAGYEIEDLKYVRKNNFSKEQRIKAREAIELYIYRIKKYIGQYAALMNGVDAIIYTGMIGFGSSLLRNMIMDKMDYLGKVDILVVESNEELAIAGMVKKSFLR